jgi:hypothetical protein
MGVTGAARGGVRALTENQGAEVSKIKHPRLKKAKSYEHDRRNTYGEPPHAARKSIPKSKARVRRGERHEVRQALNRAEHVELSDSDAMEDADSAMASAVLHRLRGFKKIPDTALGKIVARKLENRIATHGARKKRREQADRLDRLNRSLKK